MIEEEGRESVFVKERERERMLKNTGEVGNVCTGDSDHKRSPAADNPVADNPNTKTYFFYNSNLACCEESEVQSSASFTFISFLATSMTL